MLDTRRAVSLSLQAKTARARGFALGASLLASCLVFVAGPAGAASSEGCEGGGFSLVLPGSTIPTGGEGTTPAASLGASFLVKGKYVQFEVVSATLGIRNYKLTGAPNALDITGGVATTIFASKTPNHRGLVLNSALEFDLTDGAVELTRDGAGLSMKIQGKDCAQGGLFQMEPERGDGTTTDITHTLAPATFYFDNPNFRAREGDFVPYKDILVQVTPRINWANDFSRKFVGRDSPQVATRVLPTNPVCNNPILTRNNTTVTVNHCGGVSVWRVASGGRMGMVIGEDSIEVAPPATNCVRQCQAQNRVRGRSVKLGFPFPVPDASRLKPRAAP